MTRELWTHPLFRLGLGLKLALVVVIAPEVQSLWFVPFIQAWIGQPGLDPWTDFLRQGGDFLAFPYGVVMFLAHLPGVLVGITVAGV